MEKHIVSFSGGKDSTAMLLMMIEKGMKVDEIVFIDTTAEFPAMYDHVSQVEKMVNRKITRLKFGNSFEFYMLDYIKTKGKAKGNKGYGWCGGMCRWGTTMKKQIFQRYVKEKYSNKIFEYQGIAADEQKRLRKNKDKKWIVKYPLAEWKITETKALTYCYSKSLTWDNLYRYLDRVSCWCCRNKNLKELKNIYLYMPETWSKMKELESDIGEQYRKECSLLELEKRFYLEESQINMFDLAI